MSVNSVHLVGRAGRDAEVKFFESGSVKGNFTIAVNRIGKNDEPDWFELELWGKTAEIAGNYVKKGHLVGIKGSLKIDSWTDKTTGAARSKPVIRVEKLDLLTSKKDSESGGYNGGYTGAEM
ncbi:MAG: Single-stranded DNA-binding protein [Chroococcopsis gigantea SAG 12.99]|nr:single-stranded DNA-binding protein [Chlorogloea purpurea SAG 13.99]MDV3001629.1 Single-stranded DNA-binding protein [Chroococcopsis gigantea SAG 12.99]